MTLPYVTNVFAPTRRATRVVRVGDVVIGLTTPLMVTAISPAN